MKCREFVLQIPCQSTTLAHDTFIIILSQLIYCNNMIFCKQLFTPFPVPQNIVDIFVNISLLPRQCSILKHKKSLAQHHKTLSYSPYFQSLFLFSNILNKFSSSNFFIAAFILGNSVFFSIRLTCVLTVTSSTHRFFAIFR